MPPQAVVVFDRDRKLMRERAKTVVLLERIELSTSPLPRECSTSELQQRRALGSAWRVSSV